MNVSRNTNLDLLRIISMLMVVCLHFFNHGGLVEDALVYGEANWYLGNIIYAFCTVAVNCFVLISGYFLCNASFKLKKLASIWVQALFYSVGLYLLCSLRSGLSITELIKSGLVMTLQRYWFVTAYLLMYILFPFLNHAIRNMNKRRHFLCCAVLLIIFSVLPNVVYINDFSGINGGSSVLWFCVLYMVAAYIRLYVPENDHHGKRYAIVYILCTLCIAGWRFLAFAITPKLFGRVVLDSLFYSKNSVLAVTASIGLFFAFRTIHIKGNILRRVIGFFAPLAFGVYLIHDHTTIRPLLWSWLSPAAYAQNPWMVPYAVLCVMEIFLVCCLVERIRQWLFRITRLQKLLDRVCDRIQNHGTSWLNSET